MTCCADDMAFLGFACEYDSAYDLKEKSWVRVTASVSCEYWADYHGEGPVLHAIKVEETVAPKEEIINYFIWRQNDATRNSIQSLGRAHFSQKELMGLNNSQIQDKLHEEKGVNWNNCSVVAKRGTCVKRNMNEEKSNWIIDTNIPIFTQDRNYIEEVLPKEEA